MSAEGLHGVRRAGPLVPPRPLRRVPRREAVRPACAGFLSLYGRILAKTVFFMGAFYRNLSFYGRILAKTV